MNRVTALGLLVAPVLAVGALALFPFSTGAETESAPAKEVVLVRCATDASTFQVTAYQGSAATPARRSENCPEVLAHLLREGFEIANVGYSHVDSNFVVYTLLR